MLPAMARRTVTPRSVNRRPANPRNAALLYIVLGLCALLGSGALALFPQVALRGAQVADASVVALRGDDTAGWAPVVQFAEKNGGLIRWSGTQRSKPAAYAVGDHLRVLYVPDNPEAIAIVSVWRIYLPALASGVLGLLFLVIGLLGLRAVRRQG
jgi:Protein of unknown function (DUF3592)